MCVWGGGGQVPLTSPHSHQQPPTAVDQSTNVTKFSIQDKDGVSADMTRDDTGLENKIFISCSLYPLSKLIFNSRIGSRCRCHEFETWSGPILNRHYSLTSFDASRAVVGY